MSEDGSEPDSQSRITNDGLEEDEISAFEAANYVFQIAGELSVMAKGKGLARVADALERVRNAAAQAMLDERRKANPHSES